jgi:hypothetical protein
MRVHELTHSYLQQAAQSASATGLGLLRDKAVLIRNRKESRLEGDDRVYGRPGLCGQDYQLSYSTRASPVHPSVGAEVLASVDQLDTEAGTLVPPGCSLRGDFMLYCQRENICDGTNPGEWR